MWSLELTKNGLANLQLPLDDCALLARALMLAEDQTTEGLAIRGYRLAFQALTIALVYQDNINQDFQAQAKISLQELGQQCDLT